MPDAQLVMAVIAHTRVQMHSDPVLVVIDPIPSRDGSHRNAASACQSWTNVKRVFVALDAELKAALGRPDGTILPVDWNVRPWLGKPAAAPAMPKVDRPVGDTQTGKGKGEAKGSGSKGSGGKSKGSGGKGKGKAKAGPSKTSGPTTLPHAPAPQRVLEFWRRLPAAGQPLKEGLEIVAAHPGNRFYAQNGPKRTRGAADEA